MPRQVDRSPKVVRTDAALAGADGSSHKLLARRVLSHVSRANSTTNLITDRVLNPACRCHVVVVMSPSSHRRQHVRVGRSRLCLRRDAVDDRCRREHLAGAVRLGPIAPTHVIGWGAQVADTGRPRGGVRKPTSQATRSRRQRPPVSPVPWAMRRVPATSGGPRGRSGAGRRTGARCRCRWMPDVGDFRRRERGVADATLTA